MRRPGVRWLAVAGLFTLLTAAMTWPQALSLGSRAAQHQDVYFNMWRLGWVAHAASTGLVRSADLVEWVPALTWRVAPPAAWVVGVYYAALLSAWVLSKRARRPTRPMVRW